MATALKKKRTPEFVNRLVRELRRAMPGCETDVERIGSTNRYRFAVVWKGFPKSNHLRRQDKVWKIADDVLSHEELLRVIVIVALRPDELPEAK